MLLTIALAAVTKQAFSPALSFALSESITATWHCTGNVVVTYSCDDCDSSNLTVAAACLTLTDLMRSAAGFGDVISMAGN